MDRQGMLSERFDEAVAYALHAHDRQVRKGTEIPYAAHLLGVASLVLESGGGEDEAIAALLHDVVEDQGGLTREDDVKRRFGGRIAAIVRECSAEQKTDGAGWRLRKQRYMDGIATCSPSALMISAADKLHNIRAIADDYRALGSRVWDRFSADEPKGESVLWYYQSLIEAYSARSDAPARLVAAISRTVAQLERLMSRPPCPVCGAGDVTLIVWGMPTPDDMQAAPDDVSFGGCVVMVDSPDFLCQLCGHGWQAERPRW
ncbi:MAG TPA: HD domain-containing protein [Frankiaceae bacterium]|nr:HD domain-containing protein [Frankiaceae bacterium]